MYLKPMNETVSEKVDSSDSLCNVDLDLELENNSYLKNEIERFSNAMAEVRQSKVGRLALVLERLQNRVSPFGRRFYLSEAINIAPLPLDERVVFAKKISLAGIVHGNDGYLSSEYARLLGDSHVSCDADVDEDNLRELEDTNAELYQQLLKSQAAVEESLGGLKGLCLRLIEAVWDTFQFGKSRVNYLRSLWADFKVFRQSHADDLAGFSSNRFNRLRYFTQVLRYALAHPYASLRTFSWQRLLRLARVLLGLEQLNGAAWIEQRFPLGSSMGAKPIIFPVDEKNCESFELTFPKCEKPLVSIIIPVYNQYATTFSCLQSVLAHTNEVEYEVIIADDRSSDITETISERVKHIRVARNEVNLGFLKNCNNAAKFAKGKFIVLLNNDTNPQPGWLQSLLDVFSEQKNVGLVGPKLLFEDGVLQEAGGIIWRDGSGWNFGRGQSPDAPEFNYVKDVDYVSGACVMIEKALWNELEGFDERFCPAYYEDTDLAFQIRARGLRTIFQPASSVVHFEGVSHGSDINSGIKKQQRVNQAVFRKKWKTELDSKHYGVGVDVFDARERENRLRTILFIDHYVPFYDKDAGSKSTFLYVKTMLEMGYRVKFLGANFFPHQPYTNTLQQLGVEVLYGEAYAKNWKQWLENNVGHIDVIYLHRPHITEDFIDDILTLKGCPELVYFGHDLHYLRTAREADITGETKLLKVAEEWKERECAIFDKVDTVLYPSDLEVKAVKSLKPEVKVDQLPLYVLSETNTSFVHAERKDLLFVGGFVHSPNVDAVKWLVQDILPSILSICPDLQLHIVGSNVPEQVEALAGEHVVVHGFLSDEALEELYKSIRVCVVPLRFGAGVKGKVLEALQAGVPLVTTPIGAEGIPEAERVMAIAESAAEFSENVATLYRNPESCEEMLRGRSQFISEYFSLKVVKSTIEKHFGAVN